MTSIILSHPCFLIILNTLRKIFLTLAPPPTLLGKLPSLIIIKTVLIWSKIIYISLIGAIASLTLSTGTLIFSEINSHVLSISSTSSIFNKQLYGPNLVHISLSRLIFNFLVINSKLCLKVSIYEVADPLISQGILSSPIPVSIIVIGNSSNVPSWYVLNWVKTISPTSKPLMKYSIQGPQFPPPAQTSSINVISSGLIPSSWVNQL